MERTPNPRATEPTGTQVSALQLIFQGGDLMGGCCDPIQVGRLLSGACTVLGCLPRAKAKETHAVLQRGKVWALRYWLPGLDASVSSSVTLDKCLSTCA